MKSNFLPVAHRIRKCNVSLLNVMISHRDLYIGKYRQVIQTYSFERYFYYLKFQIHKNQEHVIWIDRKDQIKFFETESFWYCQISNFLVTARCNIWSL